MIWLLGYFLGLALTARWLYWIGAHEDAVERGHSSGQIGFAFAFNLVLWPVYWLTFLWLVFTDVE